MLTKVLILTRSSFVNSLGLTVGYSVSSVECVRRSVTDRGLLQSGASLGCCPTEHMQRRRWLPTYRRGRIKGLLAFSYRFSIDLNIKFSVTKRVNTHIESGILEAGGGCWGEKSSLGLHHQIPPSPLPVSPHQMTHLQGTKLLFFTCTKKKKMHVYAVKWKVHGIHRICTQDGKSLTSANITRI